MHKVMKIINLLIILFAFLPFLSAQKEAVKVQDPMAEPILEQLSEFFSSEKAYHIEFKYVIESKPDNYKTEDYGSVIVQGEKYKLKIEDGEVIYNGVKMWTYNPENNEVYVSTPDSGNLDQMILAPFILLTRYKDYFKYRFMGESKSLSKTVYDIELYPINLDSNFSILKIQTDKSSGKLHSFVLQQKNGIYYTVQIKEMITNVKISSDTFEWKKELYPDALIIEL